MTTTNKVDRLAYRVRSRLPEVEFLKRSERAILNRTSTSKLVRQIIREALNTAEERAATPERPSEAARLAEAWDPAQLLVARGLGAEWLDRYAADWRHVGLEITGDDLIEAGVAEGPAIGRGLEAALSGKLDGELSGREQELGVALAAARGEIPE